MDPNQITYFAETDSRNKRIKFGIKAKDRLKHVYVIGKTGMGKSTLLENMAIQDIQNGNGIAFIDPHGGTAEKLLEYVPESRIKDVIYFAPFDIEHPISFNVMEDIGEEKRHLVVSGLMSAFKKLFGEESFSDRMQYILQNTILALLEYPGATMLGINKMLVDKEYRNKVIANITDPSVKTYWTKEYAGYTERFAAEAIPAIQNKIGQFTSNPLVRNIIGQPKSSFDFRDVMDKGKIMIINMSKGKVGEGNANLIGSMLITKIYLAAMSRADAGESTLVKLPNFYLYVDEFQSFANKSFADILSEARKYKLNLTIAHQYIEQMEEEVRDAVFGNVGTMITFRVGAFDAEVLEKEFAPTFAAEDLVNLGFAQIYLKLMIDGVSSQPFSATTMAPIAKPEVTYAEQVITESRRQFTNPREKVEKEIQEWHNDGSQKNEPKPNPELSAPRNNFDGPREKRPNNEKSEQPAPVNNLEKKPDFVEKRQNGNNIDNGVPQRTNEKKDDPNKLAFLKASEDLKRISESKRVSDIPEKEEMKDKNFSLNNLKKDDKKIPSAENMSSLKDALSSVIAKNKTDNTTESATIPKPIEPEKKTEENISEQKSEKESAPKKEENFSNKKNEEKKNVGNKEVPEDVLRDILSMEEKK